MSQQLDPQLRRVLERLASESDRYSADTDDEAEDAFPGITRAVQRGLVDRFQLSSLEDWWWYEINAEGRLAIGLPPEPELQKIGISGRLLDRLPVWLVRLIAPFVESKE